MVVSAVPDVLAPVSAVPVESLQQPPIDQHLHAQGSDGGESEYESADDEELGEEEEEDDEELLIMPDGVGLDEENKQLDDDEDRKNPQYIPKKGTFYEHDDRTAADVEDVEKPPEEPVVKKEVASKKKVWKEDNKWHHDKFNEFDQSPKSREELIAIYGYDIRNEEGPPRARRRRRYGRGPNKYTRNWEDLDAYAKPVRGGTVRGALGRGGNRSLSGSKKLIYDNEEFPALNSPHQNRPKSNQMDDRNALDSQSPRNDNRRHPSDDHLIIENEPPKHSPGQYQQQYHQQQNKNNSMMSPYQSPDSKVDNYVGRGGRGGRGRGRGSNRGSSRDGNRYNDDKGMNNYDNYSGGRGSRGGGGQQKAPSHLQSHVDEISADLKNINISSQIREERQHKKNRGGMENRRNMVPPRLQESAAAAAGRGRGNASPSGDNSASSRPKRYSSQRQRSIPDQPVPPFQQQSGYIDPSLEAGYQGGGGGGAVVYEGGVNPATSHTVAAPPPPPPSQQHPLAAGAPPSFVPPAFTSPPTFPPEPFLGRPPAPRMFPPVTQSPHLFPGAPLGAPPPVGAPPVPTGPPVTGPPFIPHEINYAPQPGPHTGALPGAAPLAGPPHPPQFPPFQGYTPGPVSQPGEIYSNGVTYYNTESQQHIPRCGVPLQKRPKAAIPIVPPPERQKRENDSEIQSDENQDDQQYVDASYSHDPSEVDENPEFYEGTEEESVLDDSSPTEKVHIEIEQETQSEQIEHNEDQPTNKETVVDQIIVKEPTPSIEENQGSKTEVSIETEPSLTETSSEIETVSRIETIKSEVPEVEAPSSGDIKLNSSLSTDLPVENKTSESVVEEMS